MRFFTSAVWPRRAPAATASTWMKRANTCASGRNSSVLAPCADTTLPSRATAFAARSPKFAWVSSQPFGRPVVPDV